jgi:hypothetical protein
MSQDRLKKQVERAMLDGGLHKHVSSVAKRFDQARPKLGSDNGGRLDSDIPVSLRLDSSGLRPCAFSAVAMLAASMGEQDDSSALTGRRQARAEQPVVIQRRLDRHHAIAARLL